MATWLPSLASTFVGPIPTHEGTPIHSSNRARSAWPTSMNVAYGPTAAGDMPSSYVMNASSTEYWTALLENARTMPIMRRLMSL